jgi:hypothetical protein
MRGDGQPPGAALADAVIVDQYDSKSLLVNEIPLSGRYLEGTLHLNEPSHKSLMAIESVWNLFDVVRGDPLLIDREQSTLDSDGIYAFNLPGFSLKGVFNAFQGKLRIVEPRATRDPISNSAENGSRQTASSATQSGVFPYMEERRNRRVGRRISRKARLRPRLRFSVWTMCRSFGG